MADDWDLNAVVKSCTNTNKNNNTATCSNTTDNLKNNSNIKNEAWPRIQENDENPLACLASLTFEQENDSFGFSSLLDTNNNTTNNSIFEGLEEFFKPFQNPLPCDFGVDLAPNTPSPTMVNATNPHLDPPLPAGINGPHINSSNMLVPPPPPPQQPPPQFHAHAVPLVPPFHPPLRPRKRKSQQKKTVCLVTAENLSSDMWAWRKYGQKPIKGSPYPRNYYRCSSSKGCSARKQVERSIVEPAMFTVSYTGDHNHPRPTHRNSLAGSTRSKFNPLIAPKPERRVVYLPAQTLSPTTPLFTAPTVPIYEDGIDDLKINEKSGSQEFADSGGEQNNRAANEGGGDDDYEDNFLISNEDVFLRFHGLEGRFCLSPPSPLSVDTFSGSHERSNSLAS